jgi:hypothetical protein
LERSPDQLDFWGGFHQHLDDIESIGNARIVQQSEPLLGATNDPVLLFSGHSGVRRAEGIGGARFHFDKDQCLFTSIAANQIDFAASFRSEVLVEHSKSIPAEIVGSQFFALSTECQMGRGKSPANRSWPDSNGKESTSEQPARMSADESDKVRESGGFQDAQAFHSLCSAQNRIAGTRNATFSSYGLA